ncbi:MAG: hypothetical protein WD009_05695 [Phycisphaeraceae bacterium]
MDENDARRLVDSIKAMGPDGAKRVVEFAARELDGLAAQVWAFGMATGSRRAVAIVAQMGAELGLCAAQLYEAERWYAGACLVRQLIEVEYLLFLFATDSEEPERWLKASPETVRRMFSPYAMRKRAGDRFRASEYASHCELGGHPRRQGHVLLREHLSFSDHRAMPLADPAVLWVDLAQHMERLWGNYRDAVENHSPTNVYPDRFREVDQVFSAWRSNDQTPGRI